MRYDTVLILVCHLGQQVEQDRVHSRSMSRLDQLVHQADHSQHREQKAMLVSATSAASAVSVVLLVLFQWC